jgi:transposase
MDVGAVKAPTIQRSQIMQAITTIGLDIAKSVFQVHGIDAEGNVILRRQLKRRYVLVLPEAAAVSGWYRGLRIVASLVARAGRSATLCA